MNVDARSQSVTQSTVVLTGAAGHIGRALATALVERGNHVIMTDVMAEGTDLCGEIGSAGPGTCEYVRLDLASVEEVEAGCREIRSRFPTIDLLINNAAMAASSASSGYMAPFAEQTAAAFIDAMQVNLVAPFIFARELAGALASSPAGCIVNIASIYGLVAADPRLYDGTNMVTPIAYATSKAGLIQMTRSLATELAPRVRVNAIAPGGISRRQPEAFVERYVSRTPLQRMGTEADMVGAVLWLGSPSAGYVTGQCLAVDGGWTAW